MLLGEGTGEIGDQRYHSAEENAEKSGAIYGTVYTPELKTIANIKLYMGNVAETVTDKNGWFEFRNIPVGEYEIYTILKEEYSKENMHYLDPETNEKYIPYVVEPSVGVERLLLAVLTNAYEEEELEGGETREVLHLHPALAPYKVVLILVLPPLTLTVL